MLSIAICEDEPHMTEELKEKVGMYFVANGLSYQLDCHASGEQLVFARRDYDIILMDIKLPGMSGMEAARQLRCNHKTCAIIFITSSCEDVFEAFDVDAVHFLVKPVDKNTLYPALAKAVNRVQKADHASLTIAKGNAMRKILLADILYCEAINHQIQFCLENGERPVYYHKMGDILDMMDKRFIQCHRSYIVNLAHIEALEENTARMSNGDCVLISRRNRNELSQRLLVFLRGELLE